MTSHLLGNLSISFADNGEVSNYLRSEFAVLPETNKKPDIECYEVSNLKQLGEFSTRNGRIWVSKDGYRIDMPNLCASVLRTGSKWIVKFVVMPGGRRHKLLKDKPAVIQRMCNWNYLTIAEENAKGIVYDVLDQVIQVRQLEMNQTFLHSSAIEKNGDVYVIAGWGGVGKTSSVMSLISEHEFKFLSDDLGILDSEATFWRSPKRIQIYPYNLVGSETLTARLLGDRTFVDRQHWNIRTKRFGIKGVRRRVSAEEFFGSHAVAKSGQVKGFIHLERGNFDATKIESSNSADASRRTSHILVHELNPMAEIGAAFSGANIDSPFETSRWRETTELVLAKALAQVPCFSVKVPEATTPKQLAKTLLELIEQ